ncbi:response regulator transcription factor [Stratiformator vulcanicus]|uniref:Alkaline phosphatase synthesis transcriptional regulatory protein PhoP n=1 Tax=Stratiformator vulcanicus TaxID=2527980 RepID=A0A517QYI8_9PLAN|nr:response regulator [Stratiformator vulcanicus]QDT36702.1 Alkaline phosphatase synthesis transcriptional regulatory protein PhoP [Stratiformator vulcanicus]
MTIKVSICDDEPHITRAVAMKLSKAGFNVESYSDAEDLWSKFTEFKPQLVVTDYQMPRMDGLSLIRNLRAHPEGQDVPVVLLTAKGFELEQSELNLMGGTIRLCPKPFSPRELLAVCKELCADASIEA